MVRWSGCIWAPIGSLTKIAMILGLGLRVKLKLSNYHSQDPEGIFNEDLVAGSPRQVKHLESIGALGHP